MIFLVKENTSDRQKIYLLIIHLLIGALSAYSKWPLILWFHATLLISVPLILTTKKFDEYALLVTYFISFEVIGRMAKCSPFIPYEVAKYLFFLFLILGISKGFVKGLEGFIMLLLLLPGAMINKAGEVPILEWVFNFFGPLDTCLAIVVFKRQKVSLKTLLNISRNCVYPLVAMLSFVVIRTPSYDDIKFSLAANFATTGGFGSNQVSSMFGLGAFIIFIFIFTKVKFSGNRKVDIGLMLLFLYQALLTFSRGGLIGGILSIAIIAYYSVRKEGLKRFGKLIPVAIILIGIFFVANEVTGGNLLLRYKGETSSTLAGYREKDLNVITSGRFDIFQQDLELFFDNPLAGVGVGSSSRLREVHGYHRAAAHVELSRLLAEHGLLGLIYFIMLLFIGLQIFTARGNLFLKSIKLAFYMLALYTTFHSAMRTFLTPLFLGLSLLTIYIPAKSNSKTKDEKEKEEPIKTVN